MQKQWKMNYAANFYVINKFHIRFSYMIVFNQKTSHAFNALMQYVSCFFVASADDYLEEIFMRKSQKCAPY